MPTFPFYRTESEAEPNQFMAMSKLHPFGNGLGNMMSSDSSTSLEKDNNKNNLLLAMLWLQRHREMMSLQQSDAAANSKVSQSHVFYPRF